jgi:hypothetical protein
MTNDINNTLQIKGISMVAFSQNDYTLPEYQTLLADEKNVGFNYVRLGNTYVIDPTTGAITDWTDAVGRDGTETIPNIIAAIVDAQAKGFQVMLSPGVLSPNSSIDVPSLTTLDYNINNPDAFFSSFKSFMLDWAKIAQQYKVPILDLGDEMRATTKPEYTHYWNDIIDSIRSIYSGKLVYSAIDPREIAQIGFWSKLDYVGFEPYMRCLSKIGFDSTYSLGRMKEESAKKIHGICIDRSRSRKCSKSI